jgi:hypothetical protein
MLRWELLNILTGASGGSKVRVMFSEFKRFFLQCESRLTCVEPKFSGLSHAATTLLAFNGVPLAGNLGFENAAGLSERAASKKQFLLSVH